MMTGHVVGKQVARRIFRSSEERKEKPSSDRFVLYGAHLTGHNRTKLNNPALTLSTMR